jgi:Ca2+-binding EF-hand superfamily protein
LSVLFDKYDKNKNLKISAEELRDAFAADHGINLQDEEVKAIKDYFMNKFRAPKITK